MATTAAEGLGSRVLFSKFSPEDMFIEREMERGREGEKNSDLLFYLSMRSLVDSHICSAWGLNLQPWCMGTML